MRRQPMIAVKKILVPVDFSDCSRAALQYAIHFGNALKAATLDVLHVWQAPSFLEPEAKIVVGEREQTLGEFTRSKAGQAMKEFLAELEEGGSFEVFGRLESGEPRETILEIATTGGYDLIIMGTHGETHGAKLGSIAEKVVRNATCPVLTVRAECAEEKADQSKREPL
jgi:nucleotide-binding universal stress UspA family protein